MVSGAKARILTQGGLSTKSQIRLKSNKWADSHKPVSEINKTKE